MESVEQYTGNRKAGQGMANVGDGAWFLLPTPSKWYATLGQASR